VLLLVCKYLPLHLNQTAAPSTSHVSISLTDSHDQNTYNRVHYNPVNIIQLIGNRASDVQSNDLHLSDIQGMENQTTESRANGNSMAKKSDNINNILVKEEPPLAAPVDLASDEFYCVFGRYDNKSNFVSSNLQLKACPQPSQMMTLDHLGTEIMKSKGGGVFAILEPPSEFLVKQITVDAHGIVWGFIKVAKMCTVPPPSDYVLNLN